MALDSSKAEAEEARKADVEFAKLVMATQLKGAKFVPPEPIRTRGGGRAVTLRSRSPIAGIVMLFLVLAGLFAYEMTKDGQNPFQ
jgi:hypothetical protein